MRTSFESFSANKRQIKQFNYLTRRKHAPPLLFYREIDINKVIKSDLTKPDANINTIQEY